MKRRTFLRMMGTGTSLIGGGLAVLDPRSVLAALKRETVRLQEFGKYDLLLKDGHVIDPANGRNGKMDVAVVGCSIAAVGKNIPVTDAKKTIDVSGLYVTPGFIDIHVHVFYTDFLAATRRVIADDLCYPSGVTTVLDTGSSGANNFEEFKKIIDRSKTRILALINVCAAGMNSEEQNPAQFKIEPMLEMARTYQDLIVGFKTAHYWTTQPYDSIHTPWASVDALMEAGRSAGLPVMFDFFPRVLSDGYPARSYRELILEKSRPGDIHTHCYARHIPVIGENGRVNPDIFKAQERGFIFDVGHGTGSFVYRNAIPAIEQGYLPNSISTDLHGRNTNGPVVNMANVMSKFLCMGVPLEDVIRMSTINPARIINRPDLGSLTPGHPADIAIFEILKGKYSFVDTSGGKEFGTKKFYVNVTIAGGDVTFDPWGLGYPEWRKVPNDEEYWINPSGQLY